MKLLLRWLITALALGAAVLLVPGIRVESDRAWLTVAAMAIILGLVNAFVRPLLKLLSCPLILVTMGLFLLVVNAFTLWLASAIAAAIGVPFFVDGFWPAFVGGLVISVVSFLLSMFLIDDRER
ncbi:MAG TPA: phage holin family protein [Anaerolineales bacterium]|nr:phage holin family protein [Anaerolineales bacterium]